MIISARTMFGVRAGDKRQLTRFTDAVSYKPLIMVLA